MGDTARNPIVTFLWQYVLERVVLFSPRSVWQNALHPQGVTCELPNLSEKSPSQDAESQPHHQLNPCVTVERLCQHIRSHCLLNSLLSSFIWDRWKVTFRTTRVCKIKLKCKQDPSKFSKATSTMSLWVAGCWECGVWIPHACTCLPALEKRWGQAPKSFCQAKYQINIIMTAHSYFNSYFTRNHHDHINFVPNVLIIFISSVTTYRTPHISTEIPQVTIYHFYWIVLKLLPTLQSFFSDLVATLDIVIILCYLYYFSRLFYIF